jgi:GNAT superfamily N-acetyltransferase
MAEMRCKGILVSMGMAVLEHDMVGLFDILTTEHMRNQGFGTELINGLLQWAQINEARSAYLQVVESNKPAIRLYEKLGFKTVYKYWYKIFSEKQLPDFGKEIPAYSDLMRTQQ